MIPSNCPLNSLGIQSIRECALLCQERAARKPVWIAVTLTGQGVYGRTEELPATDYQTGSEEDATPSGVRTLCLKGLGARPQNHIFVPHLADPRPRDTESSPTFQEFDPSWTLYEIPTVNRPCA